MRLKASILFAVVVSPAFALAAPRPATPHFKGPTVRDTQQTARTRVPKARVRTTQARTR
ncbi:MAG: hypothetical protein JST61_10910 [Acidobacteria bacterium]|nr:hypothetical protein [Acidobacteriota bacterium]